MMTFNEIGYAIRNFYQDHRALVWVEVGILFAVLAVVTYFSPFTDKDMDEGIQYVQVLRGSLTESIGEVGFVEAEPTAALMWESSGNVSDYAIKVGDQVEKGQVLMELEFSSWSNTSLEAQAQLLEAELALENLITADTDLHAALLAVTDAEWTLRDKKEDRDAWNWAQSPDDRIDTVRNAYLASVQNYWVAEAEYEALRQTSTEDDPELVAAYESLQEVGLDRDKLLRAFNQILGHPYDLDVETDFVEYDQAVDDLAVARLAYERQLNSDQIITAAQAQVQALENTINNARILAPFDGTITYIAYLPGENAVSGEVALQIDDLSNLIVNTVVSEVDISKVKIGQQVIIKFDALPYKDYNGIVTRIASAGNDENGSVVFDVTVAITDVDASLKPGFSANINIIIGQAEDALLVSNEALMGQSGNFRVMVKNEEQNLMPVAVEIGASSDTYTEVISGDIQEGDQLMVIVNADGAQPGGGGFGLMGGMRQVTGGGSGIGGGGGSNK